MPLISNSVASLYNGVSEQAAEHKHETQVKSMVNAMPTIDRGLLKRNPTTKLHLDKSVTYTDNMWTYEYDRGLSGDSEEKYSMQVTSAGLEIINVLNGKVYKDGDGLTYEGAAKDYLFPFAGINGYSSTTIKDTTFLVNKNRSPRMLLIDSGNGEDVDIHEAAIELSSTQTLSPNYYNVDNAWTPKYAYGTTVLVVDGITIVVSTDKVDFVPLTSWFWGERPPHQPESYETYTAKLVAALENALDRNLYLVDMTSDYILHISKLDGTAVVVSTSITFNYPDGTSEPRGNAGSFIIGTTYSNAIDQVILPEETYLTEGYMWVKSSNAANAYTYTITLVDSLSNTITKSVTNTTTDGAADDLVTAINGDAGGHFTASTALGSIFKITANNGLMTSVSAGDSWGNLATFGWAHKVAISQDLPKNMGYGNTIVNVVGNADNDFSSYWLTYSDGQWQETIDPSDNTEYDTTTMPHILVRNADDTFTFKTYDGWIGKKVGDAVSSKQPSFTQSEENQNPVIRDIFFFKNRLGFITDRTVIMSEVGAYGNFWRTTCVAVIDSDPIDTTVNTTKAIQLEYATYLEDSVMLFSDKAQFKLEGGQVLGPKSVQIPQTSAYEINKSIRPIYMNDKIFFVAKRGKYSAIMQYYITPNNDNSEAIDISSHIQTYIPQDAIKLSGSSINNMLFIVTASDDKAIYAYKYMDDGEKRIQSAWFRWTFNGHIYGAFSLGRNLNILIERNKSVEIEDWVVATGVWDNSKLWDNSQPWVMSPTSLDRTNQFETMQIAPIDYTETFYDDLGSDNETMIPTEVNFGKWIYSVNGKKDIRGHLNFKTIQISSETDSDFELFIDDLSRGDRRIVKSKYTVGRKPLVYGDAKQIEVGIRNLTSNGFRINAVSYEGALTKRDKKL